MYLVFLVLVSWTHLSCSHKDLYRALCMIYKLAYLTHWLKTSIWQKGWVTYTTAAECVQYKLGKKRLNESSLSPGTNETSLSSFWKHIKIDFLQSNCRSVRRGLDKTSNPPQSHLYTDDPSSLPAAACKWVKKKSILSLCDSWQTWFVVKAMSASVSAYRSLDRRTDRPRSFANSSAVSEPLSDTCASRI